MVFIWVLVYGLVNVFSRRVSSALHLHNGLTALTMSLYVTVLLVWLITTGRGLRMGLRLPARRDAAMVLKLTPLVLLPACNLLHAEQAPASLDLLIVLLCAAVAEELLFRGWLLSGLSSRPLTAICVSSLTFALLHAANLFYTGDIRSVLLQMLYALTFAFSCGAVTLRSGSLIPAIGAHALVNLTGAASSPPAYVIGVCSALYALYGACLCRPYFINHEEIQL